MHFISFHLLTSNFSHIHLIISSIILPPPSRLSTLHDCLFVRPSFPSHSLSPLFACLFSCISFINLPSSLLLCHSPLLTLTSPTPLAFTVCRYLQFTLRLGSRSTLSSCPAPDQPGEGVLLHYSSDNGITWTLLQHYAYQGFHEPRYLLCLESVCVCVCVHIHLYACSIPQRYYDSINRRILRC